MLTSPEHGVATIWYDIEHFSSNPAWTWLMNNIRLVATLGSRSIARRLNRKAILDVDVPKACDVILNPQAPMALRLQGSMLYG